MHRMLFRLRTRLQPGLSQSTLLLWVLLTAPVLAQDFSVEAGFRPRQLPLNQSGQYIVRISPAINANLVPAPQVDGLRFSDTPFVSNQHTVTNARARSTVTLTYNVFPLAEGLHVVPQRAYTINGRRLSIPGARLQVVAPEAIEDRLYGLDLIVPEGPFYVGQQIPVELRLHIDRRVVEPDVGAIDVAALSDAFLKPVLPQRPDQRRTRIGSRDHIVVSWPFTLTATRSGRHSAELSMPFSFFSERPRGFFARPSQVLLRTPQPPLEILPLPEAGKPERFTGAVGQFAVDAALSTRELRVGEPLTLTLTVTGEGSFERIQPPEPEASPHWRPYPPKATLETEGDAGSRGTKTFEYLLIPQSVAAEAVPALTFSYFDPDTRRYQEVHFEPEPVEVLPGTRTSGALGARSFAAEGGHAGGTASAPGAFLRPPKAELRTLLAAAPKPFYADARYWGLQAALLALVLGLLGRSYQLQRTRGDPLHARRRQLKADLKQTEAALRSAAQSGGAGRFLQQARQWLRLVAASNQLRQAPNAQGYTLSDVLAGLERGGCDAGQQALAREVWQAAESLDFGGQSPQNLPLDDWKTRLLALKTAVPRTPS